MGEGAYEGGGGEEELEVQVEGRVVRADVDGDGGFEEVSVAFIH